MDNDRAIEIIPWSSGVENRNVNGPMKGQNAWRIGTNDEL